MTFSLKLNLASLSILGYVDKDKSNKPIWESEDRTICGQDAQGVPRIEINFYRKNKQGTKQEMKTNSAIYLTLSMEVIASNDVCGHTRGV